MDVTAQQIQREIQGIARKGDNQENNDVAGNGSQGVFEEVTWWVVFAGLGLMLVGITPIVLVIGLVMVVAGPVIQNQAASSAGRTPYPPS